MSDKSFVTLEQHKCMVCAKEFDTGNLLLDTRMRELFNMHTTTQWGLCPEHDAMYKDGYVALIEFDPAQSEVDVSADRVDPHRLWRTGQICHVRRHVLRSLSPKAIDDKEAVMFVEPATINYLAKLQAAAARAAASKGGEGDG